MSGRSCVINHLAILLLTIPAQGQVTRVHLDTLTILDDPFLSMEIFKPQPSKLVVLPDTTGENPKFITGFYSWREKKDPNFVIMIVSKPQGDLLYIDRNLDDDLTNDGPPLLFPSARDSITFDLISSSDSRQRVKLLLARKLTYRRSLDPYSDSIREAYANQIGDLNPKFAAFVGGLKGEFDFKGVRGSFYFDDRVTLRRGTLTVDGRPYAVGLFDKDNNGLFGDEDDVLVVDRKGNGLLSYTDQTQVFKLNDIFSLAGHRFKIHGLDKYGTWVELEETTDAPTSFFLQGENSSLAAGAQRIEVRQGIWDIKGKSLDGKMVALSDFRGKYILLNFWGEWCGPCLAEIPALLRAAREYSGKNVQFVGFAKVSRMDKALKVVEDSGMTWPQVFLTDDVEKYFEIAGYPTNVLILPNGRECLTTHSISDAFFKMYLH